MPDIVKDEIEKAADEWRAEARKRRGISNVDPVADTLEYCAGELTERLENALKADVWLTPDEYGQQVDVQVSAQTVRTWIREGLLPAKKIGHNRYLVRKGEQRVVRRRSA